MGEKITEIRHYVTAAGSEITIPVATVAGNHEGPTLVVTAGIHGCEYPGIVSAIKLFKELSPDDLHGTVKIIPVCSMAAFEARSMFVAPEDKVNLNRVFPGDAEGGYSEALAAHIFDEIKGADYHVDLHGGDMVEMLEPFSICHDGPTEAIRARSFDIARAYGLPNVVFSKTAGHWPDSGTTYANVCEKLGIPSAIVEVGGMGVLDDESVEKHLFGLKNVLRRFGLLAGGADAVAEPSVYDDMVWLYTQNKGLYYRLVTVGDVVQKGQTMGSVEDIFGRHLEEVTSPADGKVLFLTGNPSMPEHGLIAGIGIAK